MKNKIYEYGEWDFEFGECGYMNPSENIYTDLDGNLITGIIKDFYYFGKNDPKNNVYIEKGKLK